MALTLNFTFGAPCATGEHVAVTATLSGAVARTKTYVTDRTRLLTLPTADELEMVADVLVRVLIAQLAVKTGANIKSKVGAKAIDLTVG